jgi:hypothetical protein
MHRANLALSLAVLCLPSLAQSQQPQPAFTWKDLGDGRLELREHGQPALIYNYGPQYKAPAPEDRRRCCYIFPVYTPAGVSMLDDFPQDHWHHRGLFWAWPQVETAGKKYDLWMNMTVRDKSVAPPRTTATPSEARLDADGVWQADGKDIVRESVSLRVLPSQAAVRELEIELNWAALADPVTLRGSAESGKSYGGFSARFGPRDNTVIRTDGEILQKDEDLTPRRWAELAGTYNGRRAVLRITPDPRDPAAPYQWCLRAYGFVGASFPGKTAAVDHYTLLPGKPLTLRFRVQLRDE